MDSRQGVVLQLEVGQGANNSPQKTYRVTNCLQEPGTWTDTLVRTKQWKQDMRFGTRYVRRLYREGSLKPAAKKISKI